MWIDTHCHLDAEEFAPERDAVVRRARAAGVELAVLPAGHVDDAAALAALAHANGDAYALGVHPLAVPRAVEGDVERLRDAVRAARDDPRLVAVGEIGIDCHEPGDLARQGWFFREQLRVARDAGLPVIVHVRRSADLLLKHLRRIEVPGGIIHAFNGSAQQAQQFLARGFRLGFGGAVTYSGSQRIRRFAATLPDDALVLETDAPYILPEWRRLPDRTEPSEPADLPRIAGIVAELRGIDTSTLAALTRRNAVAALPRLQQLLV